MRALRAGWRHILDDRTLVRHVRSASFQGEKTALYEAGGKAIAENYPAYKKLTKTFTTSSDLIAVRYQIRKLIEKSDRIDKKVLPRVLYVISTQTGGTPQTNQDLMNGLSDGYHTMLLHCNSKEILLYDTSCQPHRVCETIQLKSPISAESYYSKEYDEAVSSILVRYGIELLHIRHIAWHSLSLPRLAKQMGIPVVFSFHDFYTICPTVSLLDENLVFCGGRCTETEGQCDVKLWNNNLPKLKHNFIKTWQQMMGDMLEYVDAFVTTSESAKAQIEQIYPQLKRKLFSIIPHGRDFSQLEANTAICEQFLHPSQPLRLLFPGNVGTHKGAELITQIEALDKDKRIEFHFLGNTDRMLRPIGKHYGVYKREDYHKWIRKIQPHYVGLFSIWPETYCHTLTESWASGVPAIALDMGAVGDRIRHHGGGWTIDTFDPQAIYDRLLEIANDRDGYLQKISEIRSWQLSYGRQNNISTMAAKYQEIYQQVFSASRSFQIDSDLKQQTKLGVFVKADLHQNTTHSADVRILEWLRHPNIAKRLATQFLNIDAFLQDEDAIFDLEVLLVRYDAIEPYLVKPFIAACQKRQLPFVVELDDYPIDLQEDGFSSGTTNYLDTLIQAANLVVLSDRSLAERISCLNNNVAIVANALSEFTWLRPIEPCSDLPISLFKKKSDRFKILYLNNSDRAEELEMLRPVFEELEKEGHPVELFVIGGEPEEGEETWYQHLAIPAKRQQYSQFVDWFRGVASYCNLAITPLVDTDTDTHRYSSDWHFLQYATVGLPILCSDRHPYSNFVKQEVNGILVENTTEAWCGAIAMYLNDSDRLNSIGETAKQEILARHLMSHHADSYCAIFEDLVRPNV
jgi:O-antigen biosynthesis protein